VNLFMVKPAAIFPHVRQVDQGGHIQGTGFGQVHACAGLQQVGAAYNFSQGTVAQAGQQRSHLFCNKEEEVHHMLRHAGKPLPQFFFLGGDPTGQLLVWQTRAIMQPSAIMAMEPKPNSSAPIRAPMTTSQPVLSRHQPAG
jgi:hypothetical protein